jgi:hypothetical protein
MIPFTEADFVELVNASKAASERIAELEAALRAIADGDVDADEAPAFAWRTLRGEAA